MNIYSSVLKKIIVGWGRHMYKQIMTKLQGNCHNGATYTMQPGAWVLGTDAVASPSSLAWWGQLCQNRPFVNSHYFL